MAIYKQDIVDVNLETGNIHRSFLNHSIGHKDDDADRFGIRVFRNGDPVDLSGAQCQAVFMAPDGQNIALTSYGTVSGNVAYVTLPQACYNVVGQFCLAIKLVGGGVTATVRIIDGVVDRTGATGAVAPTEAVPTYQEILAVYAQMQEDIADYESVVASQNGKIDDLKSAINAQMCPVEFTPNIANGSYYKFADGATASSTKYARTNGLWYGYGSRSAVFLNSNVYECAVAYYDATGTTSGTGYQGHDNYSPGVHYIPENAVLIGVSFRRIDQAVLTTADITAISAAFSAYAPTDTTMSINGMAADAKVTGDTFSNFKSKLNSSTFLVESIFEPASIYSFGIVQGGIAASTGKDTTSEEMNAKRQRTRYFVVEPDRTYKIVLTDPTYKIVNGWGYTSASENAGVRIIATSDNDGSIIFKADSNMTCARISFMLVSDGEMQDSDKTAIMAALHIYVITDEGLTIPFVPADAKATGEAIAEEETARENADTEIRTALGRTIDDVIIVPDEFTAWNSPPFGINSNAINPSTGADSTSANRARTKYFNVSQGKTYLFVLKSTEFKYVTMWEYSNASAEGALNKINAVDDTHIIYTPGTGAKCARMSFAHNNTSTEVTAEDRTTIKSCLKMYTLADKDLTKAYAPAEAKAVGDTIQYITGCKPIKYTEGYYFNLSGDTVDITTPTANTDYKCAAVPCSAGDVFTINGEGQTTAQIYAFIDSEGNILKKFGAYATSISTGSVFTAPADSAYLILNDKGGYQSYYGQKVTNLPETNAGELEALLENCTYIASWDDISDSGSGDTTQGWKGGYWGTDNTKHNSTTNGSIYWWTYLKASRQTIMSQYIEFIPPEGTYLRLLEFASKTSSTLLSNTYIGRKTVFKMNENSIYRVTLYGLREKAISEYLNADFISQIKIRPIYMDQKKKRTGEFIRFTVPINLGWPDTTATSTDNADPANMTDLMCILTLPTTYTPGGKKTPLVMYCHGASCRITENSWYNNGTEGEGADFLKMIRKFTAAGYAVFDVNNTRDMAGGFPDWGSLPLMSAYIKAWEYIKFNYNVEDRLFLLSASMGTAVNLNMMKWYKGSIIASIINAPRAMGIKERWTETLGEETIKKYLVSWGLEPDSILDDPTYVVPSKESVFTPDVDARFRGFYQHENLTEINGTKYIFEKFPPVKVFIGKNDSSFLTEQREYFAALQNFGNFVSIREITGVAHGNACTLAPGELREEAIAWFDRFRTVIPDEPVEEQNNS